MRSSINFAISTSLIHCIVRWGSADFEHSSVLKLTFQHWNSIESGNVHKCNSEIGTLGSSITPLWEQVPPVWFNRPPPLQKRSTRIDECCGSRRISLSDFSEIPSASGPSLFLKENVKFLDLLKRVEFCPSWAGSHSNTFPEVPIMFRGLCGNPESRQCTVLGLGMVEGWPGTWVAPELACSRRRIPVFSLFSNLHTSWAWSAQLIRLL